MRIIKYSLHYLNAIQLTVPSPLYGSCTYHVSGSVLCCLSRNKYTINTRDKTNKIALRYLTANLSTSRQFHYLTQTHIQTRCQRKYSNCNRRPNNLCSFEVNCVHRKCPDNITENKNTELRHREICIWSRYIAWDGVSTNTRKHKHIASRYGLGG
jgi:hypothetical protein